jgi:hypothetical protein
MSSQLGYLPTIRSTATDVDASRINGRLIYNSPAGFHTVTSKTTADDVTYTAGEVLGGMVLRDCAGAARTDTLPTAELLVAGYKGCCTNSSLRVVFKNVSDADELLTLATGTGMTAPAGTSLTLDRGEVKEYMLVFTNGVPGSAAVTLYQITGDNTLMVTGEEDDDSGVTINALSGIVNTTFNILAGGVAQITMTNSYVRADSIILVSVAGFSGNGRPLVWTGARSAGTTVINVANATDGGDTLAGAAEITFLIINP